VSAVRVYGGAGNYVLEVLSNNNNNIKAYVRKDFGTLGPLILLSFCLTETLDE